jgi:hypothetical protein
MQTTKHTDSVPMQPDNGATPLLLEYWIGDNMRGESGETDYTDAGVEWWMVFDDLSLAQVERFKEANNADTSPQRLRQLARQKHPFVAKAAAANPNCPNDAKAYWALSRSAPVP